VVVQKENPKAASIPLLDANREQNFIEEKFILDETDKNTEEVTIEVSDEEPTFKDI
jgi:hypothetical protein